MEILVSDLCEERHSGFKNADGSFRVLNEWTSVGMVSETHSVQVIQWVRPARIEARQPMSSTS